MLMLLLAWAVSLGLEAAVQLLRACRAGWRPKGGLALLKGLPGLTTSSIYQDRRDLHP